MTRFPLVGLVLLALVASCKSMHFSHVAILPAPEADPPRITPDERREATRIFRDFANDNGFEIREVPTNPELHAEHPPGQPTLGAMPLAFEKPMMILWAAPTQVTVEVFMDARKKTPGAFFLTRNALLERLRAQFGVDRVVLQ